MHPWRLTIKRASAFFGRFPARNDAAPLMGYAHVTADRAVALVTRPVP